MPKNRGAYKKDAFQKFVQWLAIPSSLRGADSLMLAQHGLDLDTLDAELVTIRNQKAFAEKYGIKDLGTLTDWKKYAQRENLVTPEVRKWGQRIMPDVTFAVYLRVLRKGEAKDARFLLEWMGAMPKEKSRKSAVNPDWRPEIYRLKQEPREEKASVSGNGAKAPKEPKYTTTTQPNKPMRYERYFGRS